MDGIGEFEFKVQILARCMGSALGLGRPTRIQLEIAGAPHCTRRVSVGRNAEVTIEP